LNILLLPTHQRPFDMSVFPPLVSGGAALIDLLIFF